MSDSRPFLFFVLLCLTHTDQVDNHIDKIGVKETILVIFFYNFENYFKPLIELTYEFISFVSTFLRHEFRFPMDNLTLSSFLIFGQLKEKNKFDSSLERNAYQRKG